MLQKITAVLATGLLQVTQAQESINAAANLADLIRGRQSQRQLQVEVPVEVIEKLTQVIDEEIDDSAYWETNLQLGEEMQVSQHMYLSTTTETRLENIFWWSGESDDFSGDELLQHYHYNQTRMMVEIGN